MDIERPGMRLKCLICLLGQNGIEKEKGQANF